jgi:C4-dicarboxylate-specific signal transduction histidine kinase
MATSNSTQSSTQKPTQKPNKQHANRTRLSRIRLSRSGWVWLALSGFAVVVAMQFGQAFAYALACFAPAYLLVAYWQLKRFAQHLQLQKLTLPQHCTQPHFDALLSLDFPAGLSAQTLQVQLQCRSHRSVESEQAQHHDTDISHLRSYQWGDRPDRIHWKASARSDDWLVKTADNTGVNTRAELDYNACRLSDHEDKIAELYGWLLQLHQEQAPYGLKLPGQCIAENRGAAHFHHCVTALAQLDPA